MTKPDKIDLIVQLFLAHWVFGTLGTPFPAFGKNFGVPCSSPVLALYSVFGCFGPLNNFLYYVPIIIIIVIIIIIIIITIIITIIAIVIIIIIAVVM